MRNRHGRPALPRPKLGPALRVATLCLLVLHTAPAAAQRGAFEENPRPSGAVGSKVPYDGPQYPGKPPPLGTPDRGVPFAGPPDRGERPRSSGTGFAVAPGRILTNNHVVENCGRMQARNAKDARTQARVLATDTGRDLAVLAVPEGFAPPLAFRDAPAVRRGETVVTYGFPLTGLLSSGPSLTTGDISALSGLRDNPRNFTISAPVQPGNSGGPLLDSQGNVIGVIVTKLNAARVAQMTGGDIPQNVNFAVKGTEALSFLRANGVRPRTATSSGADLRNSDVGDIANPATVFLECFR